MNEKVLKLIGDDVPWLAKRTICVGVVGSMAYGTNVATSDEDYKGVCIPPIEYYLGMAKFNSYDTTGHEGKFKYEDHDLSIMTLTKFVSDCLDGVPNNLELLFLENGYLHVDPHGYFQQLRDVRMEFLSKKCKPKLIGYAYSQIKKMENGAGGSKRDYLKAAYGYDTKFAMHAVRLLNMGIEILEQGTFTVLRPEAAYLRDVREGKYPMDEVISTIQQKQARLEWLYENSKAVPDVPDYNKINKLLINLNLQTLGDGDLR